MALRVEQGFYDWDRAIDDDGDVVEAEIPYFVFGVDDEATALEKVKAAAPDKQDDLVLQKVELVERINLDTFKVRAVYVQEDLHRLGRCCTHLHHQLLHLRSEQEHRLHGWT